MYHRNTVRAAVCVALLFAGSALAAQSAFTVLSDGDDQLYSLDLSTGFGTVVGPVGFTNVEGCAFSPDDELYGADESSASLIAIDIATGEGMLVGSFGEPDEDFGLTFDSSGDLWLVALLPPRLRSAANATPKGAESALYRVDVGTGLADFQATISPTISGIAFGAGELYGVSEVTDALYRIDRMTGDDTFVGSLGLDVESNQGLDFDASGTLWGLSDNGGQLYTIDLTTGAATLEAISNLTEAECLAIGNPVPVELQSISVE